VTLKISDLRRLCVHRQLRVTFQLRTGKDCCINEHGSTVIDGVAGCLVSEEEFQAADRLEVLSVGSRQVLSLTHDELTALAGNRRDGSSAPTVKRPPLIQSVQ
jgi:hypothetical protein